MHIETAVNRCIKNNDLESLQYAVKIIINIQTSNEIILVMGENQYIDLLSFVIKSLKNGVMASNQD